MIDRYKYIVCNRTELHRLLSETAGVDFLNVTESIDKIALDDALVIRKQDVFAASALYTYAHSIQTAIELARSPKALDVEFLQELADYFAGEADDATDRNHRAVPD